MARDIRISFKIAEDKKELLQKYADSYGVTMSALCALIIGQWLHQQEKIMNPLAESMKELFEQVLRNQLESNGEMMEFLNKALMATDRK